MIASKPPTTKHTFKPYDVQTKLEIYDTQNGVPFSIPVGYRVKVINKSGANYKISTTLHFKKIVCWASASELGLDIKPAEPPTSNDPLSGRIYQEYGIAFLQYKRAALLADAPGVGKTYQAAEAAFRVMKAMELGQDPLSLTYTKPLPYDEKNTHPDTRPEWAQPKPTYKVYPSGLTASRTSTTIAVKEPEYYWPAHKNPVTVIVAPSHLCGMWFRHIRRQYPDEHVAVATNDTKDKRMSVLTPGCRFYIVNYEMMRNAKEPKPSDYELYTHELAPGITKTEQRLKSTYVKPRTYVDALNELNPICVIFDESHRLKSSKSKQARVCAEFSYTIPYRFLLTATPIKREADDLHWQLHIIDPHAFEADTFQYFMREYCLYKSGSYGKYNVQLKDYAKRRLWFNRIEALEAKAYDAGSLFTKKTSTKYNVNFSEPNLRGYILGRSYRDVGLYLPPIIPASIPVQMNTEARKVYDNMRKTYVAQFENGNTVDINSMIAMMHALRILTACENKFEAVKEIIEESDAQGPFVIFCEYKPSGNYLARYLGTTFISGEIPEEDRESLIERLLREGKPIVGMGRVIGTGINALADCNTIINFEADYTPGERTQRIGRVQRFSPNRKPGEPILLFDVMVMDTIDEKVYAVQRDRGVAIRDIITTELGIK